MKNESHRLRMIRRAGRCDIDDYELKASVEQQEQPAPKKEAQADDEERSEPRGGEKLAQLCAGYLVSQTPQKLCFAVLAGQTAGVFIPIAGAMYRAFHRITADHGS